MLKDLKAHVTHVTKDDLQNQNDKTGRRSHAYCINDKVILSIYICFTSVTTRGAMRRGVARLQGASPHPPKMWKIFTACFLRIKCFMFFNTAAILATFDGVQCYAAFKRSTVSVLVATMAEEAHPVMSSLSITGS